MKLNFDDDTFYLIVKLGWIMVGLVIMWLVI
jgi:hypothetical protein